MRILITGSRDWQDRDLIYQTLNQVAEHHLLMFEPDEFGNTSVDPSKLTVVHGACPTGADAAADDWCLSNNFVAETHSADWRKYGKRAGFIRNSEMVKLGADICYAFIKNNSKGASMTAYLAEKSGIKVVRVVGE